MAISVLPRSPGKRVGGAELCQVWQLWVLDLDILLRQRGAVRPTPEDFWAQSSYRVWHPRGSGHLCT